MTKTDELIERWLPGGPGEPGHHCKPCDDCRKLASMLRLAMEELKCTDAGIQSCLEIGYEPDRRCDHCRTRAAIEEEAGKP